MKSTHWREEALPVTVVIPHIGKSEILYTCLRSLTNETRIAFDVLIVDNGSDLQESRVAEILPRFRIVKNARNLGFAGGCNAGLRQVHTPYAVLLNNDTEVGANWLSSLVAFMEENPRVGACQPKILSLRFPGQFDYAGGMGGLLDRFGYPFAIGRIFDFLEEDTGQYDGHFSVFWASGTAMMLRMAALEKTGLLDEDFFAHMEEIDLCWRLHLTSYEVASVSESVVYHYSGYSLGHEAHRKMYLNHRNNWVMLLKNYAWRTLLWLVPMRLFFEGATLTVSILKRDFKRAWAVVRALGFVFLHIGKIGKKHREVQKQRQVSDLRIFEKLYRGSIVWQYFVRGRKRVSELKGCLVWRK